MRENLKRRLDTIQKNIWLTFLGVVAALAIALSVFYFFKMRDMRLKRVANDECIRAAQDALNGWDPTYGCIYYYNPQTATNQWIRSRPIVVTIGKHVFCT